MPDNLYNQNKVEQSGEKCIENARKTEVSALTGEYKHSIDNKGRLFIPAKLRDELGDVFYITLYNPFDGRLPLGLQCGKLEGIFR